MKKMVYLARFGKVHGPFTDQELENFQANGKILEFSWVWDYSARGWRPLDPPPAALFDTEAVAVPVTTRPVPAAVPLDHSADESVYRPAAGPILGSTRFETVAGEAEALPAAETMASPMDLGFPSTRGQVPVVCHNFRQVVSGVVHRMTATGCELLTTETHFSPTFVAKASVILNLLDGESGKLMNVAGRVCGVSRSRDGWTYQVRWEQRPAIQVA